MKYLELQRLEIGKMENKLTDSFLPKRKYANDLESYLQCEVLKFCGCGDVAAALSYLLKILRAFKSMDDFQAGTPAGINMFLVAWADLDKIFNSDGERYFVYYFLDREEYTEHGGSVPGWITDKGKELLMWLERWEKEENGKEVNT